MIGRMDQSLLGTSKQIKDVDMAGMIIKMGAFLRLEIACLVCIFVFGKANVLKSMANDKLYANI